MTDNELLFALSDMMDKKLDARLKPVEANIASIKMTLENNILPRLQNIESCYVCYIPDIFPKQFPNPVFHI